MKGSDKLAEKEGWIKTYRKIQDCWIWQIDESFDKRSAWIDLLLSANHKDVKLQFNNELILVERGQFITSIRKLSERWKWSYDKVSRFLKLLESDGMIKKQSDKFRTLLTIENYEVYQDVPNTNRTPISEHPEHQQVTNKNEKNEKNNIYVQNSLNESENCDDKKEKKEELENNFKIIYDSYPKKKGKTKGFEYYKAYVTTGRVVNGKREKLTNKQIWQAIANYKREIDKNETELQFVKQFDTFMNKSILDYIED